MVLENVIFLQPLLLQPGVEVLEGREGNGGEFEAAPVHVDGRGVAVDVGGAEGVDVLAVLAVSVGGLTMMEWGAGGGEEGKRIEEGWKLTVRHHRLRYSRRRILMSLLKLSDRSRSPYCAE